MTAVKRIAPVAFVLSLVPLVAFLIFGVQLEQLCFRPGWAWTWELPGIMPWLPFILYPLAAILVLMWFSRYVWPRSRLGCAFFGVAGLLLMTVGSFLPAGHSFERLHLGRRIVLLDEPGVFHRAAISAYGRAELDAKLWAMKTREGRWERISAPVDYPPCTWPFESRRSAGSARYLLVDSEVRAVALLDLTHLPPVWQIDDQLPSLDELRGEFGQDLAAIADFR